MWSKRFPLLDLEHRDTQGNGGLGIDTSPFAAGVGLTASGAILVALNHGNDTVTMFDTRSRTRIGEVALAREWRSGGGEFPLDVQVLGDDRAFVTCQRDREVV